MEAKKIKKILRDFTVAYVPYTITAVIIGLLLSVVWWKVCIIMCGVIVVNMAVNILVTVMSTYRFDILISYLKRKR